MGKQEIISRIGGLVVAISLGSDSIPMGASLAEPSPSQNPQELSWADLSSTAALSAEISSDLEPVQIRISGYLLPSAYVGTEITEFLLVPLVGACMQIPCPEAHQILQVIPNSGVEVDSLFDPVRVTGRLRQDPARTDLSILNLEERVETIYRLEASLVEHY